jgi:putative oxidoreductase
LPFHTLVITKINLFARDVDINIQFSGYYAMKQQKEIWQNIVLRIALGVLFVSGGIQHFIGDPDISYKSDFINALYATGYLWQLIGAVLTITGLMIIIKKFVPLALIISAPITVIIFTFHLSEIGKIVLRPGGYIIGTIILLLHLGLAWQYRSHYTQLFKS